MASDIIVDTYINSLQSLTRYLPVVWPVSRGVVYFPKLRASSGRLGCVLQTELSRNFLSHLSSFTQPYSYLFSSFTFFFSILAGPLCNEHSSVPTQFNPSYPTSSLLPINPPRLPLRSSHWKEENMVVIHNYGKRKFGKFQYTWHGHWYNNSTVECPKTTLTN